VRADAWEESVTGHKSYRNAGQHMEGDGQLQGSDEKQQRSVTIGVLADPGVPTEVAWHLSRNLPRKLGQRVHHHISWHLVVYSEELYLDQDGRIPLEQKADKTIRDDGCDLLICLTDLPRHDNTRPIVADINTSRGVGLASLPAIGWVRLQRHVQTTVIHLIGVLARETLQLDTPTECYRVLRRTTEWVSPVRQMPSSQRDIDVQLALTGARGRVRLLFGMVRDNHPWRLVPSLSRAIAAASAAAAFGVFFPTIWMMANAMSLVRLTLTTLFVVAAMIVWLIVHNGLWEHPRNRTEHGSASLYNTVTITTLLLGVVCMYIVLFMVTLLGATIVMPSDYLRAELGHSVGVADYGYLSWLASSLGTIAGALGSSLESEYAVRRATYSKREQQRRARRREHERHEQNET
jgi:hypothetical protein